MTFIIVLQNKQNWFINQNEMSFGVIPRIWVAVNNFS